MVVGHLPLTAFSEGRARAGECIDNAESLAAELRRARVDLVISGHHHACISMARAAPARPWSNGQWAPAFDRHAPAPHAHAAGLVDLSTNSQGNDFEPHQPVATAGRNVAE